MVASTTAAGLSIGQSSTVSDDNSTSFVGVSAFSVILNLSRFVTVSSGTQTWYLVAFNSVSVTAANGTFDAYRIG